jgi:hypothetical protein
VVDWENPKTKGMSVYEMEYSEDCPKCNVALKNTLRNYPEVIWYTEL